MTWFELVIWGWPSGLLPRVLGEDWGRGRGSGRSGSCWHFWWKGRAAAEAVWRRVGIPVLGCAHLLRFPHEGTLVPEAP